jgi:hypothetical protein
VTLPYFGYNGRLLRLLDLNEEQSFGTIYSVELLLACAAVLLVLTFAAWRRETSGQRDSRWWLGLAALFVFLSADEGIGFHELLIGSIQRTFHVSGVLYYAWIIPYAGLVLAVVVLYARFLLRLPRQAAVRFVIAGAIYVGGAVGMEMVAGYLVQSRGYSEQSLPLEIEYLVEETMEMLGAAYFLTALLRYIELCGQPLELAVAIPNSPAPRSRKPSMTPARRGSHHVMQRGGRRAMRRSPVPLARRAG